VHRYLEAINAAKSAIMSRCSFSPSPMSVSTTKPVSAIARANAAGSAPSAAMDMRGMPSAAAICAPVHTVSPSSTTAAGARHRRRSAEARCVNKGVGGRYGPREDPGAQGQARG